MTAGDVREGVGERSRHRPCRRPKPIIGAAELEVLGKRDEPRAAGRGVGRKARGELDIPVDVLGRGKLDERDGEPHSVIVALGPGNLRKSEAAG